MEKTIHTNSNSILNQLCRPNKRFLIVAAFMFSLCILSLLRFSPINDCVLNEYITEQKDHATFFDLNQLEATSKANIEQEQVLILTPLKNAAKYLDRYFELIEHLDYPKELISIAFLVSDTTDNTTEILKTKSDQLQLNSFTIYEKDFKFELPEDKRHSFEAQPIRRSFMARSRNYLLMTALKAEHSWVLWLDVDVTRYSTSILKDLQSLNVDVVVPNCLRETEDNSFWGYDKNNWQETAKSLEIQKNLEPEYVLLEGYEEFPTGRYAMVDMPTNGDLLETVPLDGVGATFTLVKANVHREGANFPVFPYKHQVETEGFAKVAKSMGYGVYGLPSYIIYHANNS